MNDIVARSLDDDKKKRIVDFMNSSGITKNDIIAYSPEFPDRVMRNLIESETIFYLAQC